MIDVYESQRTSCPPSMERLRGGGALASSSSSAAAPKTPTRDGVCLDLIYVTERIISISFPAVGTADSAYRYVSIRRTTEAAAMDRWLDGRSMELVYFIYFQTLIQGANGRSGEDAPFEAWLQICHL